MTSPTPIRSTDAAATLDEFRGRLLGELILPADEKYQEARQAKGLRYNRFPSMIVRTADPADVTQAVKFARRHHLPFSVRSGGHSIPQYSVIDGAITIDMSEMKKVEIDPETRIARVQAGAVSRDLAGPANEHGLALSTGDAGSVGLGGLVTGGGVGWFVRKYGLSVDRLRSAKVVTAEGELITASADENADLFWAIRGGGGNFGIVVEFAFELVPVEFVYGGAIVLPATREVLRGYLDYVTEAPDELNTMATLIGAPPAPFIPEDKVGQPVFLVLAAWCGDPAQGPAAMAPLRALADPIADTVDTVPYPVMFQYMEFAEARHGAAIRMTFADEVPDATIEDILDAVENAPSPTCGLHIRGLGGELARIPKESTAFPHRDKKYFVSVLGLWFDPEDDGAEVIAWSEQLWANLSPIRDGVYVNFLGDEGEARVREAYANGVYEKLAAVKAKYDPENVFKFNQNVRPAAEAKAKAA